MVKRTGPEVIEEIVKAVKPVKVLVAAWQFSASALKKLKAAGATVLSINELHDKKKIGRIIG